MHTGQNYDYELNEIFFDELGIRKPDHFLDVAGRDARRDHRQRHRALRRACWQGAARRAAAARRHQQLPRGDRGQAAARSRSSTWRPGNRCFDERVPEEINRRIVDHTSDINLPYTEHARRYLLAEGLRPETVIKTGSPMREVLAPLSHADRRLRRARAARARSAARYFVVSAHREENVDDPTGIFATSLATLAGGRRRATGCRSSFSTHPRTRKRLEASGGRARPTPTCAS